MLDRDFPFAFFLLPIGRNDLGIELHVTIQIPLPGGPLNIILNRGTTRVETRPIRIWVEGESLLNKQVNNATSLIMESESLRKYEQAHRTARQGTYSPTTFHQYHSGLQK